MALHTVCFLLLLFSMLPSFDATDCTRGLYCPAGSDCNSDNSLCEAGSDNCTAAKTKIPDCNKGITAFFTRSYFEVRENNGPVEPVIRLSKILPCCSVSFKITIRDATTKANVDYVFPRGGYVQAIAPGGMNSASFSVSIRDDNIIEGNEFFEITIVKESLPHGYTWAGPETVPVYILDDDSGCVYLERSQTAYTVRENANFLLITLGLTTEASFDIDAFIDPTPNTARECDFEDANHRATFKAGNKRATVRLNITDDDIYEESEGFNFSILRDTTNDAVKRCSTGRYRGSVTIMDDERKINAKFDASRYTVVEDEGSLSPLLILDRPSPCCITVLAELVDGTATGRGVDYGYSPPEQYKYVFPAGETCAEPDKPILIENDRMSERDETFMIRMVECSVPFDIQPSRTAPTITIKDADIEVCFEKDAYEIDEDKKELKLKLKLDKSATGDFELQVFSVDDTAEGGINYVAGPYNVTFRKNSRISNEFSVGIMKDPTYTGNKYFSLMIDDGHLPIPLVACESNKANVTIVDNEYTLCFNQRDVTIIEGDRSSTIKLDLSTSKRLSRPVRVDFNYSNGTGHPATRSPVPRGGVADYSGPASSSVSMTTTIRITIMGDTILEYNETFAISIPDGLMHNSSAAADCITKVDVLIINDDSCTVNFQRTSYPPFINKNALIKPVIELSNQIEFPIQVIQQVENGTAKSREDYVVQETYPVIINSYIQNGDLPIALVDDDVVELLIEEFYVNIKAVALANGGTVHGVYIGKDNRTTIPIKDDDACIVMVINGGIVFSKPIFSNVSIEIFQPTGPTFFQWMMPKQTYYPFNAAAIKIDKIRVCIPKALYDEPRRRVTSNSAQVVICSY